MFSFKNISSKSVMLLLFSILPFVLFSQDVKKQGKKKRIAVLTFEDKTSSGYRWGYYKDVGDGVTEMILTELVKSGKYQVIERTRIDKLIAEQKLQQSGLVSEQSAVEIGKLLGVELAVFGAVTEFGYKEDGQRARVFGKSVSVGKKGATVGIDIRIINVTTGEIITADNISKEESNNSFGVSTRKVDFSSQAKFDESVVGKATRKAVEGIIELINKDAAKVKWSAKVVINRNGKIYINSGSIDGVQVGEVFDVFRAGEALIDPDTGLNLGAIEKKIGTIKVIDNSTGEGKAAICEIVSGSGFDRGDIVKEQ